MPLTRAGLVIGCDRLTALANLRLTGFLPDDLGCRTSPGGGQLFYKGAALDPSPGSFPTIVTGMDVGAIAGVVLKEALRLGPHRLGELSREALNGQLSRLPHKPDDRLR